MGEDMNLVAMPGQFARQRVQITFRAADGDVALPDEGDFHREV